MKIPGPRPDTEPVYHGGYEWGRIYLRGDTVTYDGETWRALNDFKSGLLTPDLVARDCPGVYWERVQ